MTRLPDPCIYLITDRRQLMPSARTPAEEVVGLERRLDEAIDLVDVIQIRERDLSAAVLHALVRAVAGRARGSRTRVLVTDRIDVAAAAAAAGVHLRADGPPIARARALAPREWIVGRSVHDVAEAQAHQDADYLLFGTVFPSRSKPDGWAAQGLEPLADVVRAARVPVLAVGGMTIDGAAACRRAGAAGVAAIGLFLPEKSVAGARGIRGAVISLRAVLDHPRLLQ